MLNWPTVNSFTDGLASITLTRQRLIIGSPQCVLLLAAALILWISARAGGEAFATGRNQPRVLVLYSDERLLPANIIADEAIRTTLAAGIPGGVEFHSEFLDSARFPGEAHELRQRDFLRAKYQQRPPALLIAGGAPALDFLVKHRSELFRNVPIVYCSVAGDRPELQSDKGIAGVPVFTGAGPALELALRLHPETRQVALVWGSGARDQEMTARFREDLRTFEGRVAITVLTGLSMGDLRNALARLPEHTVVLYLTLFQDVSGRTFTPRQALSEFAPTSNAPIYGCYDTYVGHGIVGGMMVPFDEIGRKAAQVGLRILAGEDPQTAARSETHQPLAIFDWQQLRRWGIDEDLLPPGSIVRFKEQTYWQKHFRVILGAAVVCSLEAGLIVALLVQGRRRHRAEASLRESEASVSLAAESAGAGLWAADRSGGNLWLTERARELFGFKPDEAPDWDRLHDVIHPADRERVEQVARKSMKEGKPFVVEFRVDGNGSGKPRWVMSRGRPHLGANGNPDRLMGASVDISERKQAEAELNERRAELAHLSRVTMLGELSGSLAHELNQPLTAILSNAQAAQRYLEIETPNLAEVREILVDIVSEDERAGEVIRRLRLLLKKGEVQQQALDANEVAREVLKLVRSDLVNQGVTVETQFAPDLGPICGDRVQLQQVLLNLVMNACDAMAGNDPGRRRLTLRTRAEGGAGLRIEVSDIGRGLPEGGAERAFERFFTTKSHGLGLGLSICRTIINAHDGHLGAANNPQGGATFHCTLPLAKVPC